MKEWQKRVVQEHIELADKILKCRLFMEGDQAMLISKIDYWHLSNQLDTMDDYLVILAARIARF